MRPPGTDARRLVALLLNAALAGCVPDFVPASQLDDTPQVLAIRAERAEVAPGEVVRLDALVHYPAGTPEHLWLVCVPSEADTLETCVANRLGGGGVLLLPCNLAPTEPLCYASTGATALYTVPADLPLDEEGSATIFIELVVGDDVQSDACVEAYRDLNPSSDCLVALKRLAVSTEPSNVNPGLQDLYLDSLPLSGGTRIVVPEGAQGDDLELILTAVPDDDTLDEVDFTPGPQEEGREYVYPVAWYSDCGKFSEDTTSVECLVSSMSAGYVVDCLRTSVTWKPGGSGECTVHVVLRDGRGGVDWRTQRFVVGGGG